MNKAGVKLSLIICLLAIPSILQAKKIKLVSWNLEHMMSEEAYQNWYEHCSKRDFKNYNKNPPRVTYCSAHSGVILGTNINAYKPLHSWNDYLGKIAGLKAEHQKLQAEIYALQEISDKKALELIFDDEEYSLIASDYETPLNLGFAVKKSLNVEIEYRVLDSFALQKGAYYRARPALELSLKAPNFKLKILTLHLKSGCKNFVIDSPETKSKRIKQIISNCQVLKHQVKALKNWHKRMINLKSPFIIMGDFNRLFGWELNQIYTRGAPLRLENSDSFDISSPITKNTKIAYLYSELNFATDYLNRLRIIFPEFKVGKYKKRSKCRYGDNYFIHNQRLKKLLQPNHPELVAKASVYPQKFYSPQVALPSDHCPISLELDFKNISLIY